MIITIIRRLYMCHKKVFDFILMVLLLIYVNLMFPVLIKRRNYSQSDIEYIV